MRTVIIVATQYDGIVNAGVFAIPDDTDAVLRLVKETVNTQGVVRIEIIIPT